MASVPLEDIKRAIKEEGFWTEEDAGIGFQVDHIVRNGFKFKNHEGIRLLKTALSKAVSHFIPRSKQAQSNSPKRETIEAHFEKSGLGFYKIYGQTKHHHTVISRTPELRILVVFAWSSRSEVLLHCGSHLHGISTRSEERRVGKECRYRLSP